MDMRESFEAHMRAGGHSDADFVRFSNGNYANPFIQDDWRFWQAATAAADERAVGIVRDVKADMSVEPWDAVTIIEQRIKERT